MMMMMMIDWQRYAMPRLRSDATLLVGPGFSSWPTRFHPITCCCYHFSY